MAAWLICPKCGEIYPEERICPNCMVETVPSCPFCERLLQECECKYKKITTTMLKESPYIRKALIGGIIKGLYRENFQNIELVVVYGSLERDVDLLILNNAVKVISPLCLRLGASNLDIIELSKSLLLHKLEMLDPIYTEPILTGEICLGNPALINELREKIANTKLTQKSLIYLYNEGLMLLNSALSMISMYVYDRNQRQMQKGDMQINTRCIDEMLDLEHENDKKDFNSAAAESAIVNLSFSCSYLAFCKHYNQNHEVITYSQLLEANKNGLLYEIEDYKKRILRGEVPRINRLILLAVAVKKQYKDFERSTLPHITGLPYWGRKEDIR